MKKNKKVVNMEPSNKEILEVMLNFSQNIDLSLEGIEKNMRQGFTQLRIETSQGLSDIRSEVRQLSTKLDDMEKDLKRIQKRTIQDSDAQAKDIIQLREKYKEFGHRLKKLETQKSRG